MTLASRRCIKAAPVETVLVKDTFTDTAGTALTAHHADTGQSWTIQTAGSAAQIVGGTQLGNPSGAQSTAVIDSGNANVTASVVCNSGSSGYGICWRSVDDNNYWIISLIPGGTCTAFKRVAGSFTSLATFTGFTTGHTVKVVVSGSTHTLFVDTAQVAQFTDSFNSTATKHGLYWNGTNGQWDNFEVDTP